MFRSTVVVHATSGYLSVRSWRCRCTRGPARGWSWPWRSWSMRASGGASSSLLEQGRGGAWGCSCKGATGAGRQPGGGSGRRLRDELEDDDGRQQQRKSYRGTRRPGWTGPGTGLQGEDGRPRAQRREEATRGRGAAERMGQGPIEEEGGEAAALGTRVQQLLLSAARSRRGTWPPELRTRGGVERAGRGGRQGAGAASGAQGKEEDRGGSGDGLGRAGPGKWAPGNFLLSLSFISFLFLLFCF